MIKIAKNGNEMQVFTALISLKSRWQFFSAIEGYQVVWNTCVWGRIQPIWNSVSSFHSCPFINYSSQ